jgi:hypothetical protein
MQRSGADAHTTSCPQKLSGIYGLRRWLTVLAAMLAAWPVGRALASDPADPIINLFLQKGFITENEASKAKAEIEEIRTNQSQEMPHVPESKWKISEGIKSVQ